MEVEREPYVCPSPTVAQCRKAYVLCMIVVHEGMPPKVGLLQVCIPLYRERAYTVGLHIPPINTFFPLLANLM